MKSCKVYLFFIVLSGIAGLLNAQGARYVYSVPNIPWEESLGNHRAILQIDESSEVFTLDFDWRRPDRNIDETCFLILHAETGDTVQNIKRVDVSAEKCKLIDVYKRQGVRFTNSFVANSLSGPSRACMITGKHSCANKFYDNTTCVFDSAQQTFPKLLQKVGYQTALVGK